MTISLWEYYVRRATAITDGALASVTTLEAWTRDRPRLMREFRVSMGLDPFPEKCDLALRTVAELARPGVRVRTVCYQILPDCWASAALFFPDPLPAGRLPAVLVVSGHSAIGLMGGQVLALQWARRGYVAMVFDTLMQNDNPGEHHGLASGRRPEWISMGYTSAGGELWNSIRALDVLCGCPEVDPGAIGATGASGGGAHSFYLAVADERIRAVASCCGVTRPKYTLDRQHLMTHCDCMYYHNVFQRDMAEFGALIAPRPALFCYGTRDYLFSADEYAGLVASMKRVYRLYGREADCELFTFEGPHGYKPEVLAAVNPWFDARLAGGPRPGPARPAEQIPESELSVFHGTPPEPNRLALVPDLLSPAGTVALPREPEAWAGIRDGTVARLRERVFQGIETRPSLRWERLGDWLKGASDCRKYRAAAGANELWLETYVPHARADDTFCLAIADGAETGRSLWVQVNERAGARRLAVLVPRFGGFNAPPALQQSVLHRAGCLTGLLPVTLMVEDVLAGLAALRGLPEGRDAPIVLYGRGEAGAAALYAALLDPTVAGLVLDSVPATHRAGAPILGILRVLDMAQATGLMAPRPVGFVRGAPPLWAARAYERLGVPERLVSGPELGGVLNAVASCIPAGARTCSKK